MEYSLLNAAKAAQVNKSTVLRAIKSGRLSARREEGGTYRIDASELSRVFDLRHLAPVATQGAEVAMPQRATANRSTDAPSAPLDTVVAVEVAVLRTQVQMLEGERERWERERETMLSAHRDVLEDLRKRLDQEQEERRTLQRQLAPPAQQAAQTAPEQPTGAPAVADPSKVSKGFLARLLGL